MDHRRTPRSDPFSSPWLAVALGLLLVILVGAAVVVSNGMLGPSASPGSTTTPGPSVPPTASVLPSLTPSAVPSFVRPTPTPQPTFTTYVVRERDSLTTIARAYATSPRSIAWWNRGTYPSLDPESATYDPNHIIPGWRLTLIPGTIVDDAHAPTPSPAPPTPTPGPTSPAPSQG